MKTTRDAILYGELVMDQPVDGPRVSVDTVLLSAWVNIKRNERVLELGSAHGAVSLLVARRFGYSFVEGLEIQKELVDIAIINAESNALADRVSFRQGDLRRVRDIYPAQSFDVIFVNPPYDEAQRSRHSPSVSEAVARHGTECTLEDVVTASRYLLANRGRLFMILRAKRCPELISLLSRERIEAKRMRPVYPVPGREASVILVQASRASGKGMTLEPPLFIKDGDGNYTPELLDAYRIEGTSCP
ncbi:MAG TPA: methyltransferase domain-containing protein [Synergistales bacterium]|jgi:tRNA1(Val) A37 N6-methylase TrmN6|nr:methyltransferase domain-containing protein [Synergistales bacterium]